MLCLLVLSLTLSTTVGELVWHPAFGEIESECNDAYQHLPYLFYNIFNHLGSYGKRSGDDMVLGILCGEAPRYPHETGCSSPSDNNPHIEANTNKTFFQKLVPIIQNIEEQFKEGSQYNQRCPIPKWSPENYIPDLEDLKHFYYARFGFWVEPYREMLMDSLRMIEMHRIYPKLLKSLHNVKVEQELVKEAVETVLGASPVSVDPLELIALHLRKQDEESKSLLKIVLAKYISSYLTTDRVRCLFQLLSRNKFLNNPRSTMNEEGFGYEFGFNIQNDAVKKIIKTTTEVIERDGTLPYIELAHALVDELDRIKIPEIMNTQYMNFLKIQKLISTIPWKDDWKSLVKASSPLYQVFKSLICDEDENMKSSDILTQLFQNMKTESSDESLDYHIKVLLNIVPSVLIEIGNWDCEECANPSNITSFLKINKGIIGTLFNTAIESTHLFKFFDAPRHTIDIILSEERIFENISKHILKDLSQEQKQMIQEPLKDFIEFVSNLVWQKQIALMTM